MLTIALSSMMMITFRAALYSVREEVGALAKSEDIEVVQYQQNIVEEEEGDLHLTESHDADGENAQKSKDEVVQQEQNDDILDADKAVQIY
jgi:hypothetical protein